MAKTTSCPRCRRLGNPTRVRPPFFTESVFDRIFGNRVAVTQLIRMLQEFLESVAQADSNIRIRNKRAELAGLIRDEVFQFAAELHATRRRLEHVAKCLLNSAEQCWLDSRARRHR